MLARWVSVQRLNQPEMRLLAEKVSDQPETWDIEDKLVEFSLPSWQVITLKEVRESSLKFILIVAQMAFDPIHPCFEHVC